MVEKSCVHPFIDHTQVAFTANSSLREVLGTIKGYQELASSFITNVSPEVRLLHGLGSTTIFLGSVVLYEYARAHGAPFPDSGEIIGRILPIASISEDGDEYYDTDTFVWRYGREKGFEGEELRKKVDEHRKTGHGQIDRDIEDGRMTPEEAERAKRRWDEKHGYRGR